MRYAGPGLLFMRIEKTLISKRFIKTRWPHDANCLKEFKNEQSNVSLISDEINCSFVLSLKS